MVRKKKTKSGASAYDTALSYLTPKARTVREVELRLDEGDYSEAEIFTVIERLREAGLLDDERYARDFVESRLKTKPVSRFRLREQLLGHHVPEETIEAVLDSLPDSSEDDNAAEVARKFMRQFSGIEDEDEKRRRVYMRLKTRGYEHDTIIRALREAEE